MTPDHLAIRLCSKRLTWQSFSAGFRSGGGDSGISSRSQLRQEVRRPKRTILHAREERNQQKSPNISDKKRSEWAKRDTEVIPNIRKSPFPGKHNADRRAEQSEASPLLHQLCDCRPEPAGQRSYSNNHKGVCSPCSSLRLQASREVLCLSSTHTHTHTHKGNK